MCVEVSLGLDTQITVAHIVQLDALIPELGSDCALR
jgi:hypothetical protein